MAPSQPEIQIAGDCWLMCGWILSRQAAAERGWILCDHAATQWNLGSGWRRLQQPDRV